MNPRESLEVLPVLSRVRGALPVVSVVMPSNRRDLRVLEVIVLVIVSFALANLFRFSPERPFVPLVTVCALFALSGLRRGQDTYADEARRTTDLSLLVGVDPGAAYCAATSTAVRRQAVQLVLVFGVVNVAVQLLSGAGGGASVRATIPVVALPALALLLREVVAHAAVVAQNVVIPQYLYLVAGCAVGFGLHLAGGGPGAVGVASAPDLSLAALGAGAAGILVLAGLHRLVPQARRVPMLDLTRVALPRRAARLPMPLFVYLWRARGRKRSSVIIGFAAILTLLAINLAEIVRALPTLGNAYARPELAMVLVYAIAYLTATLVETPLDLRGASERTHLVRLVAASGAREMSHSTVAVVVPTVAASLTVSVLAVHFGALPGVPAIVVAACAVLLGLAATNVVTIPEMTHGTGPSGGPADDFPMREVLRSAFVALLASALIVGGAASSASTRLGVAVALVVAVALSVVLGARLRSTIRRHI